MEDIYREGYIIHYNEGDRSLQREVIIHNPTLDDSLHIIKQGDTLITISAMHYGTGRQWYIIADVNNIINPFELTLGSSLIIPNIKLL